MDVVLPEHLIEFVEPAPVVRVVRRNVEEVALAALHALENHARDERRRRPYIRDDLKPADERANAACKIPELRLIEEGDAFAGDDQGPVAEGPERPLQMGSRVLVSRLPPWPALAPPPIPTFRPEHLEYDRAVVRSFSGVAVADDLAVRKTAKALLDR